MNDLIIQLQYMLIARDMAMANKSTQDSKDDYEYEFNSFINELKHLIDENKQLKDDFNNLVISNDELIKENEMIARELTRLLLASCSIIIQKPS